MPKVKLNQETFFQYDGVTLFPEWNEISESDFEKLKSATLSFDLRVLETTESLEPKVKNKGGRPPKSQALEEVEVEKTSE